MIRILGRAVVVATLLTTSGCQPAPDTFPAERRMLAACAGGSMTPDSARALAAQEGLRDMTRSELDELIRGWSEGEPSEQVVDAAGWAAEPGQPYLFVAHTRAPPEEEGDPPQDQRECAIGRDQAEGRRFIEAAFELNPAPFSITLHGDTTYVFFRPMREGGAELSIHTPGRAPFARLRPAGGGYIWVVFTDAEPRAPPKDAPSAPIVRMTREAFVSEFDFPRATIYSRVTPLSPNPAATRTPPR